MPERDAWGQAFAMLAFDCPHRVADIVVAGLHAATDHNQRGQWLRIADCLNRIHDSRTMQ